MGWRVTNGGSCDEKGCELNTSALTQSKRFMLN